MAKKIGEAAPRRQHTESRIPALALVSMLLALGLAAAPLGALDGERLAQAVGQRLEARLYYRLTTPQRLDGPLPLWVRLGDSRAQHSLQRIAEQQLARDSWQPIVLEAPALADLLAAPGTLEVQLATRHRPLGRHSLRAVGGAKVHAGVELEAAYRGRGVLVGLIDTGIDAYHPAFLDEAGRTRVVGVWDQDKRGGRAPEGFSYGDACDAERLRSGRCTIGDDIGHGTHVAGIAAGHAHLVGGVAPEAAIAMVRSRSFERLADASMYLMRLAQARHQPLVINISVGGHYGPHDGHSPLEQFLARHAGRGRTIVAAAGNEGDRPLHVALRPAAVAEDGEVRLALTRAPVMPLHTPAPDASALLELWGLDGGDAIRPEGVAIELWQRQQRVMRQPLELGGERRALRVGPHELTAVRARRERPSGWGRDDARRQRFVGISLAIEPLDDLLEALGLSLVVAVRLGGSGTQPVHGWLSAVDGLCAPLVFDAPAGPLPGWARGDPRSTLAIPATSDAVLSVGSATVQRTWRDVHNKVRSVPLETLGGLSTFSSLGPLAWGGVTKPELVAPGSVVVSARAACVPDGGDTLGALTMVMQGTSMAAPHVSGTVALMYEAAGALEPAQVRRLLLDATRAAPTLHPAAEDGWGRGQLDTQAAVHAAEGAQGGCRQGPSDGLLPTMMLGVLVAVRRRNTRKLASKAPA